MATFIPVVIGENAQNISEEGITLLNLTLDNDCLIAFFSPILDEIARNIEIFYKTPAKLQFLSTTLPHGNTLKDITQFDDICIKFLHIDTGHVFFIIVDSSLARALLTRLVASSLIEDTPGLLFSSTEKGLFSFIIARLIIELTKFLQNKMPMLKILGIFHNHEEPIKEHNHKDHIIHNFSLDFLANKHPLLLISPLIINRTISQKKTNKNLILFRCGHIQRNLSFIIYQLKISRKNLYNLQLGDMIFFDRKKITCSKFSLQGDMEAIWEHLGLSGTLIHEHNHYFFRYHKSEEKNNIMKPLEIVKDDISGFTKETEDSMENIIETMQVPVTIELSRIPMSLKEISTLQPGQLIDIQRKIGDPLEIVVDNKIIGYCSPIQINGRLGIKILTLLHKAD